MVILNVYTKNIHTKDHTANIHILHWNGCNQTCTKLGKRTKLGFVIWKDNTKKKLPFRQSTKFFFQRLHLRINNFNVLYYSNTLRNGYSERDCTFDFLWLWSWGSPLVILAWAFHGYGYLYCDTNDAMLDSSTNCDKAYTV